MLTLPADRDPRSGSGVISRRGAIAFVAALLAFRDAAVPRRLFALSRSGRGGPHPEPRPGITAARVLTAEQLGDSPDAIPVFDLVRQIPEIVDGIRCQCGCADAPGFYSLLSCYEEHGMARYCDICQGEGRVAHRLHAAGKTLDEIRAAIDARFG